MTDDFLFPPLPDDKQPEWLYGFANGQIVKIKASNLKVCCVFKDGSVLTTWNYFPFHEYGQTKWFISEEALRERIDFEI